MERTLSILEDELAGVGTTVGHCATRTALPYDRTAAHSDPDALGANGVSLRRLALPVSVKEDFQRLLLLQIENEFPIRLTNWRGAGKRLNRATTQRPSAKSSLRQ